MILDLVMNHTSDQHAWFISSRTSREGPYADWYLWRDPAGWDAEGRPLPPNDWVSFFGGPGWEWDATRGQLYYHTFLVEQPELDWRTPGVEQAQFAMVQGWLDRGVDGFRLDVFNNFLKHPDLPSNPTRDGDSAWYRQVHLYDRDQPDFPDLAGRFRSILDAAPGRMSIGELFDGTVETAAELTTGSAPHLRLGADRRQVVRRRPSGPRSRTGRPRSGRTAGRRSSSPITISRATPRGSPTRSARATRTRSPRRPPSCP